MYIMLVVFVASSEVPIVSIAVQITVKLAIILFILQHYGHSQVNILRPDYEKFPLFRRLVYILLFALLIRDHT